MPQEDVERPLVLLVAARRAERELRLAARENEPRRERRARPRAGLQRRGQPLLEPEHLRASPERPAERRNDGRARAASRRSASPRPGCRNGRRRRRARCRRDVGSPEPSVASAAIERRHSAEPGPELARRFVVDEFAPLVVVRPSTAAVERDVGGPRTARRGRRTRAWRTPSPCARAHLGSWPPRSNPEERELLQEDRALSPRAGLAHRQSA